MGSGGHAECTGGGRIVHHVGGAAGGDMFAFGPPPLGPRRCVPAGILPAGLAGVIDGWLAAGGSAGACFCVRACWHIRRGGWSPECLGVWVFGFVRVFRNSVWIGSLGFSNSTVLWAAAW